MPDIGLRPMTHMSQAIRETVKHYGPTLQTIPDDALKDFVLIVGAFYADLRGRRSTAMPEATVMVGPTTSKETTKGDLYTTSVEHEGDKIELATFKKDIADAAGVLEGKWAHAKWREVKKENWTNRYLDEIWPKKEAEKTPEQKLGTGEYVKGKESPDTQRSIFASVALQQAVAFAASTNAAGGPNLKTDPGESWGKAIDTLTREFFFTLLTVSGQATDEDIPF